MGFGAGSLVFTGLQIGAEIASGPFRAITPGTRLLLVTAQMHFIFLNSKSLSLDKHTALAKLGLMHMIATNLCEWLQVLVRHVNVHETIFRGDDGGGQFTRGHDKIAGKAIRSLTARKSKTASFA